MKTAVNPARLELISREPIVLLDGAHNPNGIAALKKAIKRFLPGKKITCVMGMLADKDSDGALSLLKGMFERVLTVPVDNPRAMSAEELAEKFRASGTNAVSYTSAKDAIDAVIAFAKNENGAVVICGSLYLAGEVRPYLLQKFC